MSSIDERIVRMEFDNEQFESGVRTTLSTLERLKEGLVFKKNTFSNLEAGANRVDLSGIDNGIQQVQQNFSLVGEFVRTLYDRIANWSINLGRTITSALTLDPVREGFSEYQMQMESIQTIMANTKKEFAGVSEEVQLDAVNSALNELNRYADLTIYNFAEMTRNIGTFTAAGVELDDSVSAIQGIANLAAVSGASSAQASRAMYQLSQALASGTVRLMDWRSVENANMGGQFFQDALRATAEEFLSTNRQVESATGEMISYRKATGITTSTIEDLIRKHGSFRESLAEGWVTADVLVETLAKLTDVGLAEYFANATGADEEWIKSQLQAIYATDDREKATQELAETLAETGGISEETAKAYIDQMMLAQDAATKVKTLKQLIDTLKESMGSGWAKSIQLIAGDFKEALAMWTAVKDELTSIIDSAAETRNAILTIWHDSKSVGSGGRVDALQAVADVYFGIKSAVMSIKDAFEDVFGSPTIEESAAKLMEMTRGFSRFAGSLREFLESDAFVSRIQGIFGGLFTVANALFGVISGLITRLSPLTEGISQFVWYVFSAADSLGRLVKYFVEADDKFAFLKNFFSDGTVESQRFSRLLIELGLAFDSLLASVLKVFGVNIDGNPITEFISGLAEFVKSHVNLSVFDGLAEKIPSLSSLFGGLSSALGAVVDGFFAAINAVGDFAGSALDKLLGFFEGLSNITSGDFSVGFFDAVEATFNAFGPALGEFFDSISAIAPRFGEMIHSIFSYFASAEFGDLVRNLSMLSGGGLLASLATFVDSARQFRFPETSGKSIFDLFGELFGSMLGIDKWIETFDSIKKSMVDAIDALTEAFGNMQTVVNSSAILKIAISVALLTSSLSTLSGIDPEGMANGIAGLTVLFAEMMGSFNILGASLGAIDPVSMSAASTSMIKMAIAVGIMTYAVKSLSGLDPEALGVGIAGIAGMLFSMGAAVLLISTAEKGITKSAVGMIALSIAIRILVGGVMQLSGLNWGELARGLVGVAGLLVAVGAFAGLVSDVRVSFGSVLTILAVSFAVNILADAVGTLGSFDEGALTQGLRSVAGLVAVLGAFMVAIGESSSSFRNIIALAALVVSIKVLADVVKDLGSFSTESIGNGLTGLLGIAIALDLVMVVLSRIKVPLRNVLGLVAVAYSLQLLMETFSTLCGSSGTSIVGGVIALAAIVASLAGLMLLLDGDGLSVSGGNVAALIGIALALKLVSDVIISVGDMSTESLIQGLLGLVAALAVVGASSVILSKFAPEIMTASAAIGAFSLKLFALGFAMMMVSAAVASLVAALSISGFLDSISDAFSSFFDVFTNVSFFTMLGTIAVGIQSLVQALVVGLVMGIVEGTVAILNGIGDILAALDVAIHAIGDFLLANVPYVLSIVGNLVISILELISSMAPRFANVVGTFILAMLQVLATWLPAIADALINAVITLVNAVADGIRTHGPEIISAVSNIIGSIIDIVLLAIEDILRMIPGVGDFLGDKIAEARGMLTEALSPSDAETATASMMTGAQQGITSMSAGVTDSASQAGQDIQTGMQEGLGDGSEVSGNFMSELASGFSTEGFDVSGLTGTLNDTLTFDLSGAATGSVDSYASAFNVDASQLPVASLPPELSSMLSSYDPEFTTAGTGNINAYTTSLGSSTARSTASANGAAVASSGASGAGSRNWQYNNSGYYAGVGFGNGLSSAKGYVSQKAAEVAIAARMTIDRTLEVESPSKVMMRTGRFVGQGLGIGIGQLAPYVEKQSAGLGNSAINGLRESIAHVGDILNADMDFEPTITPVLDLSEIQNGASALGGILGSYGLNTGFGAGNYALNAVSGVSGRRYAASSDTHYSVYVDGARVNDIPAIHNATYDFLMTLKRYGDM